MVSAFSSQAATLNPLAYTALDGDDSSKQPASNATPTDSDRGPATQVSLSQDALEPDRRSQRHRRRSRNWCRAHRCAGAQRCLLLRDIRSALLQLQPAQEVPLAQRHAVGAQDVVGGGGVEIEIGQRERHQKALRGEGQLVIAEMKDDVTATERIDGVRRPACLLYTSPSPRDS